MNRPFHVVMVVWGQPYLDVFLDVALPNQMTSGNLDSLPAGSRYRVFTSPEDAGTLETSTMLGRVRRLMPVDVQVVADLTRRDVDPLKRMTAAHCRALADARDTQAPLVFLNADHFMSAGALAAVVRRHATGIRAVVCTGIRLNRPAFVAALNDRRASCGLPPRELALLALNHLHPFTLAQMNDAPRTASSPASIHWNVPGEGLLSRSFFLHPLMVDPVQRDAVPRGTIDAKFVGRAGLDPHQVHIVTDSDELALFELSNPDDAAVQTVPGGISRWLAAIMLAGCGSPAYWANPTRLHAGEIGPAWAPVEQQSARFASQVMQLRAMARATLMTAKRLRRFRRRAGLFVKRARVTATPLSLVQVRRSWMRAMRRLEKLGERTARSGRKLWRRAARTSVLLTDTVRRPMTKFRKRAIRAGRRALRRVHAAH